ncbi:unnamed protein product [Phyllotreta striolata]|uniref:Mab-21-like HhH/H2TH-like domain-containing protein n=1 Tax=Phyllotreta striolata TaxID=444603 RepID=A0A9N9XSB7_PHYSR|nr:unnamed protein product [Phyllotreta striolata]
MGGCCSKEENVDPSCPRDSIIGTTLSDTQVASASKEDKMIVDELKFEFNGSPQTFLLDNLLMTTQFFENYRKDREHAVSTINKQEKDTNSTLLEKLNMGCIFPDYFLETVNDNLRYRPIHGPKKYVMEPLITKRMFIINYNIEVISDNDENVQYTSIDKPAVQVTIEESGRKGFVRLRQNHANQTVNNVITSNIYEPGPSGLQNPESEYDYALITEARTPKALEGTTGPESKESLPPTCFTAKKIKKPDYLIQEIIQEKNSEGDDYDLTEDDLFDYITYIDAKGFMNHFKSNMFPNSLGRLLGFTRDEIDLARTIPGKIFCNLTDADDQPLHCEVIPCVAIPWPTEQTYEFIWREDRPTITDKKAGKWYKWPTDQMIKEMCALECVVVPKGYWMKKGHYSDTAIEWEIAFPKAERYLEARMSHVQIRCFLFLLIIHKVFIHPKTQQHGLLVEHIRCHMYWECESNYRDWPEHRQGAKIVKVIENLCQRLSKSLLPDFFIKEKNHFKNIPMKYLHFAHRIFNDVLQNPVVYFISALRCIRYTSGKFYTPFEFKEFYRNMTETNNNNLKQINPNTITGPPNIRRVYRDPEMQWEHLNEVAKRKKALEMRNKKLNKQKEEDTKSIDSIDLEWSFEKELSMLKRNVILCQYIKFFIEIAKEITRFDGSENHSRLYLKQALYLTNLLEDNSGIYKEDAREFQRQIRLEQNAVTKSAVLRNSDVPPATPVRNSQQFDYSLTQQLKNNSVNWNNLHNNYTGNTVTNKVVRTSSVKVEKMSPLLNKHQSILAKRRSTFGVTKKSVVFANPD